MNAVQMKEERLLQVILAPVISEKATMLADKRASDLPCRHHRHQARDQGRRRTALQGAGQGCEGVANVKGKNKRFGRFNGRRDDWKKAYVCLKPGQELNFAAGE
jgi:large subunit ribosomal protein L23